MILCIALLDAHPLVCRKNGSSGLERACNGKLHEESKLDIRDDEIHDVEKLIRFQVRLHILWQTG